MNSLAHLHPPAGAPASAWVARIAACWRAGLEAIFESGRLLIAAKEALPHGEFLKMVESDLPFKERMAQMLMAVAADPRLSNPQYVALLPHHITTLYDIHGLDDDQFRAHVDAGTIRPDMERRDISTVVKQAKRQTRERELGAKQHALPTKKYGVILADPEWRFEPWSRTTGMDRAADNHYPTSCTEVIASRDVASIAADDCVLFLWATGPMLPQALLVMEAWGFDYKSHMIWRKPTPITGYWFRSVHELLLVGTRGNPPAPAMGTQPASVQDAPSPGKHSAKPSVFAEMIEGFFPTLPKIELNRRGPPRENWDAWGNEAEAAA